MSNRDTLGDRIKRYEAVSDHKLTPRSPVFIRVDGKAFHTFTRGADKPFDQTIIDSMVYAATETAKQMTGFKLAYVQSDEATFMITDYDTLESQGWFGYELNKLVSITASAFTAYFNSYYCNHFIATDQSVLMAMFDARAFTVPVEDAPNVFIWRQRDWERNSIQMFARAYSSHKECQGLNVTELKDLCLSKGFDYDSIADQEKHGTFINRAFVKSYDKVTYHDIQEYFEIEAELRGNK